MNGRYILIEQHPVPEDNLLKWAKWFEESQERIIGRTVIRKTTVSTVFLALDHNFSGKGKPILFETMIFGDKFDEEQERYSTYFEAQEGHKKWVKKVEKSYGK
jgi:hypothetical protein